MTATEPDARRRFTAIYDAHHAQVYAYAVSRAGRQLADDIVADTFLVAWRKLPAVPAEPLPWLLGVARNALRERYRAEVRQAGLAAGLRAWVEEAEADVAEGVAERAAVLPALTWLSEDDRELLTLVTGASRSSRISARSRPETPTRPPGVRTARPAGGRNRRRRDSRRSSTIPRPGCAASGR
ncbi:sigma-70 family RNA polymerase sigma factor [Actinoplanes sp. NPDC026623]|uniref:RNA polymerase sigma factor n=1 Tax=Actinoplanes sp. NPDC026623 TaxID=3155610 RepID=UPI0034104F5A